ncbi:hypothetical protein MXB_1112, partial [Myxobolus squamalis]
DIKSNANIQIPVELAKELGLLKGLANGVCGTPSNSPIIQNICGGGASRVDVNSDTNNALGPAGYRGPPGPPGQPGPKGELGEGCLTDIVIKQVNKLPSYKTKCDSDKLQQIKDRLNKIERECVKVGLLGT